MPEENGEKNSRENNRENNGRPNNGGNNGKFNGNHYRNRHGRHNNRYNGNRENGPRENAENASREQTADNAQNAKPDGGRNNNFSQQRFQKRENNREHIKAPETLEDIRKDIVRIEKEIELEVSEISAIKLGI